MCTDGSEKIEIDKAELKLLIDWALMGAAEPHSAHEFACIKDLENRLLPAQSLTEGNGDKLPS